jgi:histidyl-tRNA synthetase
VVIHETFRDLAFGDFTIAINNRKVLNGFLAGLGIASPEQRAAALREVDKLDKVEAAQIRRSLTGERVGLAADVADRLLALTGTRGSNAEILAQIGEQRVDHPDFAEGLQELEQVTRMIADLQVPDARIRIDPAISRGLDYYTGTVYETFLTAHPELGSICSGGRYENLAGHYTSSRLPGVGISIGATRLFYQLLQLGLVDNQRSSVAVLVTQMDARFARDYRKIASDLRAHGLATELYPEADKLGKQLKYASKSGIAFAVIVGESEQQRSSAVLKTLATGVQSEVPWDRLARTIQDALGAEPGL